MKYDYKVSIIIPAYNSEKTIEECLTKIKDDCKNISSEIIVIDDNSKDKTFEILQKIKSIKAIKLKKTEELDMFAI